MWFWIAVMTFVLFVFLVTKAVARSHGDIHHVGLYAGEGRFVHATTHGRPVVQESRLDEPHWRERYRVARRPR